MYLVLFLYIASFLSLVLGEFGQFPFGNTYFSVSAADILLFLALCALLIWNIGINKNLQIPPKFNFLMVFWSICFLSLLFSLDLSGGYYLARFIVYSGSFYLTFHLINSRILGLKEFLSLVKITGVSLAVFGLLQLIFFPDLEYLLQLGFDPHKFRIFSTFLDPNFLGTFLNFSFILLLYDLVIKKSDAQDVSKIRWDFAVLILLGIVIILTFSRSAYLMLGVSLLILLSVKNRKLLLGLVILTIILYFTFPSFNQRINGAFSVDASASKRLISWEKGLTIFQQNPILGVGFNNIRNYSQKENLLPTFSVDGENSGSGIDSSLIFVLAAAGLIGFICFILFLIKVMLDLIRISLLHTKFFYNLKFRKFEFFKISLIVPFFNKWYRDSEKRKNVNNDLGFPLFSLSVGLLINSFFINSLFFPPILFLWFSLLGIYYGLGVGEGEGEGS